MIDVRDSLGRAAIHFACKAGNIDTFKVLIEDDNCDVDAVSFAGVSPLMNAIDSGNIELVVLCLNEKLNPFLKDALERSALDYAANFTNVHGKHNMRQIIEQA